MNSKESAKRIRQLLAERDLSGRDLARLAGLGDTSSLSNAIKRLADGKSVNASTLALIAKALGVSEHWILHGLEYVEGSSEPERTGDETSENDAAPQSQDVPEPSEMPETLGQRRDYGRQEAAAKKELARRGEAVEDWVWPHVRATNNFTLANTAPSVQMLCELAKFIYAHGDPSARPKR